MAKKVPTKWNGSRHVPLNAAELAELRRVEAAKKKDEAARKAAKKKPGETLHEIEDGVKKAAVESSDAAAGVSDAGGSPGAGDGVRDGRAADDAG